MNQWEAMVQPSAGMGFPCGCGYCGTPHHPHYRRLLILTYTPASRCSQPSVLKQLWFAESLPSVIAARNQQCLYSNWGERGAYCSECPTLSLMVPAVLLPIRYVIPQSYVDCP